MLEQQIADYYEGPYRGCAVEEAEARAIVNNMSWDAKVSFIEHSIEEAEVELKGWSWWDRPIERWKRKRELRRDKITMMMVERVKQLKIDAAKRNKPAIP